MNYKRIYDDLILKASIRCISKGVYYEKHHIIPRCMSGSDEDSNLVKLTAREHYIAHQLLVKIYPGDMRLLYAAQMMCISRPCMDRLKSNNRWYEWLRIKYSEEFSKQQTGKGNNNYGSVWMCNFTLKQSKKIKPHLLEEYLNSGWVKGRVIKFPSSDIKCRNDAPIVFKDRIVRDSVGTPTNTTYSKIRVCKVCKTPFYCSIDLVHKTRSLTSFCSDKCRCERDNKFAKLKNFFKDPSNVKTITELHKQGKSMNAICKALGFVGAQGMYYTFTKQIIDNLSKN